MHVTVSLVNMGEGVLLALLVISALVKMDTMASVVVSISALKKYSRVRVICANTFVLLYFCSLCLANNTRPTIH